MSYRNAITVSVRASGTFGGVAPETATATSIEASGKVCAPDMRPIASARMVS